MWCGRVVRGVSQNLPHKSFLEGYFRGCAEHSTISVPGKTGALARYKFVPQRGFPASTVSRWAGTAVRYATDSNALRVVFSIPEHRESASKVLPLALPSRSRNSAQHRHGRPLAGVRPRSPYSLLKILFASTVKTVGSTVPFGSTTWVKMARAPRPFWSNTTFKVDVRTRTPDSNT